MLKMAVALSPSRLRPSIDAELDDVEAVEAVLRRAMLVRALMR